MCIYIFMNVYLQGRFCIRKHGPGGQGQGSTEWTHHDAAETGPGDHQCGREDEADADQQGNGTDLKITTTSLDATL